MMAVFPADVAARLDHKGDLKGISDFFASPLQVAMMGGSAAGDANSVIQGGGVSLTAQTGQVKRGNDEDEKKNGASSASAKSARAWRS